MSNMYVLKVSKKDLVRMKEAYQSHLKTSFPPHSFFAAKVGNTTITGYNSGKVTFQGLDAAKEANRWEKVDVSSPSTKESKKKSTHSLPKYFSSWSVIGSDEVGNGSYFGPVVVCATYVEKNMIPTLQQIGVKDSKMLTDRRIRVIAKEIKQLVPYKELIVSPAKYNQIQPDYNAVHMKVVLHNQAICLLLKQISPIKPEGILIDQFTPEENYNKYVRNENNQVHQKIHFITKGEQYHLSVAAASIICRATFLEELDKASDELGIKVPSGAGGNVDKIAKEVLKKGGIDLLGQYAKLHFANTQKAKKLYTNDY